MGRASSGVTGRQLAAVTIAFALLIAGYFAARQFMRPPTQATVEEGRASADAFLELIRDGNVGEAWDASTTEFKSIEGRESFMRKAKSTPILAEPLTFASMQKVAVNNSPRSEFLYTSTKSGKTVRILVGYEGGSWKVDRVTF